VAESFARLRAYCEAEGFQGWDPYDGLNSRVFQALPLLRSSRLARLAWIQLFKRSPVNLRRPLLVAKGYNAKGLGLFLAGYCSLYRLRPDDEVRQRIDFLVERLLELRTPGWSGACWGYNFDWQARAFFQPRQTPTVVATSYVAAGLLDAFRITGNEQCLAAARSAGDFLLRDLNRTPDGAGKFAFSYSPLDTSVVFNASLLGSRLLAQVYAHTREEGLIEAARQSAAFCCAHQREDGAWSYGTLPFHRWVDNFHTGFNLECLAEYGRHTGDRSFEVSLERGLRYYVATFFTERGESRYYDNALYPIDIHGPAQLVMTLYRLQRMEEYRELLERVLAWTIEAMQDRRGYFYYQLKKGMNARIPYMRWAQAWMFQALSLYLCYQERGYAD
jgi:hypothetical protein